MKPHGRDCPDRCSICIERAGLLDVKVHRVDAADGVLFVDGVAARAVEPDVEPSRPLPRQQRRRR